jgi:hypothetical protein
LSIHEYQSVQLLNSVSISTRAREASELRLSTGMYNKGKREKKRRKKKKKERS